MAYGHRRATAARRREHVGGHGAADRVEIGRAGPMRLLVVGATGGLGRAVVDSALSRGHDVHALARKPETAALPPTVEVAQGDVLDPASLEAAVRGCDAEATALLEQGTANLVAAMTKAAVPRLACVTLLGAGDSRRNAALLYRQVILRVVAPMVPDKENQERVVRDSDLEWVLIRPPTFVGFGARRQARVLREGERGRVGLVIRAQLADVVVRAAETDEYLRQAMAVGR